ncbi:MAG: GNAT family N-acetyltransferase [Clostridia bacterium]|nr:GNAT family N-acetyltransferase [Clostridia bacterium]
MKLRNYKNDDANEIVTWIRNEEELFLWSANIYNKFPIEADDINNFYEECSKKSNFYPMTLIENKKIIGHLILRNIDDKKEIIRLGFIIVDLNLRGKGYGKKLIKLAIEYAKNNLNAKEINLGVFENNINAYKCYKSVGFKEDNKEKEIFKINSEEWKCIELIYNE